MLPVLVFLALAAFAAALLGGLPQAGRAATVHLMLAVGAMPLIFGAMSHFIPVLTRTRTAATGLLGIPVLALAGGTLAVSSFSVADMMWARPAGALLAADRSHCATGLEPTPPRRHAGPATPRPGLVRSRAGLSRAGPARHSCRHVLAAAHAIALRRFHLHLNTLGFIGLTAVSTLAVLLPTAVGRPDPHVAERLRRDLPWMLSGVLLIATGSAWFAPLAWIGAALWAVPLSPAGSKLAAALSQRDSCASWCSPAARRRTDRARHQHDPRHRQRLLPHRTNLVLRRRIHAAAGIRRGQPAFAGLAAPRRAKRLACKIAPQPGTLQRPPRGAILQRWDRSRNGLAMGPVD